MSYPTNTNTNLFTQPQQPQQAGGAHNVKDQLNQFKENAHVPSNQSAINQLDKASYALNGVQTSNSAQQLGPSGQRVVQDVQQLLNDQKNIIAHRNEGDALQKVIHDAQVLGQKLGGKVEGSDVSMFKSLINDWKNIFTSVTGGDEAKDMANTGSSLLRGLADTEEFLDLVSELINLAKLLISQTDAQITKDNKNNTDFKHELDQEREVVMEKLNATLNTLAANDLWTHLVQQGRSVAQKSAQQVQGAAHDAHNAVQNAAPQMQGNIWELLDSQEMQTFTEDLKTFLQRLVGDEHDVAPLFEYTKAALRDIKNDPELHKAVHAAEDTLHSVSATANEAIQDPNVNHAANPAYNAMTEYLNKQPAYAAPSNDIQRHAEEAQQNLKTVGKNLEAAMNNIRNNENLRKAREEAHVLREAFMNDPDNRQLINDARQLWHDLQSPSGGLDPALLIGLREAVVPIFLDHFNNVPIPTIHNTVSMLGKMNFTIDGIRLSIPQILPDNLYVRFEYELDTTIRSLDVHAQRLFMHLELRNMHMHLRDVAWAYQRLSAPRKSDSGHLDLDTLGDGITIKLKIQMHTDNTVEVKESHVNIQKFKTTFRDSKHNKMYSGLAHVFAHQIKKNVQKSVEAKMKEMGAQVGGKLMQTVGDLRSKSAGLLGQTNSKKQQVFEMLRNKRGQHQPKEGQGMKVRAQQVRQNHLFQNAVHKAAGEATNALDEQQRRVEERKEQAHVNKMEQQRMDNATAASHGLAPTLPSTNRPQEAPVPAMMFIPDVSGNVNTAPITAGHGLTHVNPNNSIDNRPITDAAHHSVDPEIQRVLEQKLHLNQQQQQM